MPPGFGVGQKKENYDFGLGGQGKLGEQGRERRVKVAGRSLLDRPNAVKCVSCGWATRRMTKRRRC